MKKLLAATLVFAMAFSLSLTAFAADTTIDQDTPDKNANTSVAFSVNPTYSVTIPETITLEPDDANGGYAGEAEITASQGLRLKKGEVVKVTLSTCNYVLNSDEGATLAYEVNNGAITASSNTVATFTTEANAGVQAATLSFTAEEPQYAGDYSEAVVFTVAVDKAQ